MERNPELEFEFFLAQKLSMTVAQMRHQVSSEEFLHWYIFFARKAQREELEVMKMEAKSHG